MKALDRKVAIYIGGCICSAVAVVSVILVRDATPRLLTAVIAFGVLSFLAEQFPVVMPNGSTYSVSFVFTIAAILTSGSAAAVLATLCGTLNLRSRKVSVHRHLFNASQLALSSGVAALTFSALGGHTVSSNASFSMPHLLLPLVGCTAINFLVNTILVATAVALSEKKSVIDLWRNQYVSLGPSYVGFAALGLLLGLLNVRVGWATMLFLLMPLLIARHAFQAAINMQGAYDDTVHSLISAIEAKDPYTRGHAERVSRLAEMTARAYGFSEERCRAIRYAALMHDVGKLTVQSKVLQKPGKLTDEEYEHMKIHPIRGVQIISEIDLLEEAVVGVRHHHERFDGKGYPDGLAGEQIPLFARLITVSDAFDSMTSTRVYRKAKSMDDALIELHKWSGIMFDPTCIAALEKAIGRYGWTPVPEAEEPEEIGGTDARAVSL